MVDWWRTLHLSFNTTISLGRRQHKLKGHDLKTIQFESPHLLKMTFTSIKFLVKTYTTISWAFERVGASLYHWTKNQWPSLNLLGFRPFFFVYKIVFLVISSTSRQRNWRFHQLGGQHSPCLHLTVRANKAPHHNFLDTRVAAICIRVSGKTRRY